MIQAHTGEEQLLKLINLLLDENTDIFIHVDKKNDHLFLFLLEHYNNNQNVYVLENRVSVNWSGFSQVKATINLMVAIKETNKKYDYVSLISGQDFPIKSKDYINRYLLDNYGKEFIEYKDINSLKWRLRLYNFFRESKYNRNFFVRVLDNLIRYPQKLLIKRTNFKNLDLYYGSSWFTITYSCLSFLLEYLQNSPDYYDNFKFTACSDEHFFQILIMNSEFKENVINNNLRYIDWADRKASPKTLTLVDYEALKQTNKLYARKFDYKVDSIIVDKIESSIINNS